MSDHWDRHQSGYGVDDGSEQSEPGVLENIFAAHGLEIRGNVPVDEALVFLMVDRSHAIPQLPTGAATKDALDVVGGRVLAEGEDMDAVRQAFGMEGIDDIASIEDPALYALTVLMAIAFARGEIDEEAFSSVAIEQRNKIMFLKIIQTYTGRDPEQPKTRVFVLAGKRHFSEAFLNLLNDCGIAFVLVEPKGIEADATTEQNLEYAQGFVGLDEDELCARYEAGKEALDDKLISIQGLIRLMSSGYPDDDI